MKTWTLLLLLGACGCAAQVGNQGSAPAAVNAGWEVSGIVKGQTGPLKGAYVIITGPEMLPSTRTDSSGRYTVKGSLPGTYSIRVQKPEDGTEPRSRTLTLANGQKVDRFDLSIPRGAVIAGKVTDRNGGPVSGMVVIAYLKSYEQGPLRLFQINGAQTDDAGSYRIGNLADGTYVVAAVPAVRKPLPVSKRQPDPVGPFAPAYPPLTFSPNGRSLAGAAVLEVREGEERLGADIALEKEPVRCVFFRPIAPPVDPDKDLQIWMHINEWVDTRGPIVANGRVQAGQDWQVCGLPQGEYRLGLTGLTRQPVKGVGHSRAVLMIGKENVDLGYQTMVTPQDLTGAVSVIGAKSDEPVPAGMRITLDLRDRSPLPSDVLVGTVEKNGAFTLRNVHTDAYGLRLENVPAGYYVIRVHQNGVDEKTAGVRPGGGDVRIELGSDGPALTGRVLTEDDQPVPEATVFLSRDGRDQVFTAQCDQSGAYSFSSGVAPGEYKIVAVRNLPESLRRDGRAAARFLSRAVDVKLGARERKVSDLKVRGGE